MADPRFRKEMEGKKKCKERPRVISTEELLKGNPETAKFVCLEPVCEENCPDCPVGLKT